MKKFLLFLLLIFVCFGSVYAKSALYTGLGYAYSSKDTVDKGIYGRGYVYNFGYSGAINDYILMDVVFGHIYLDNVNSVDVVVDNASQVDSSMYLSINKLDTSFDIFKMFYERFSIHGGLGFSFYLSKLESNSYYDDSLDMGLVANTGVSFDYGNIFMGFEVKYNFVKSNIKVGDSNHIDLDNMNLIFNIGILI